ncbi:MAG: T9SS type A sorting domain-containing protein [Bacteroidota bacterium]
MKRTLTTLFSLISVYVMGQQALPQVFTPPLTGFNRIREENPYILMDIATDATGTNWERNTRMTRTKSPILNKTIEDRSCAWEANAWKDQYLGKDSFITEADQTTIKTDFYYYLYNYGTFSFEQKGKYIFTNDASKRPYQILAQSANPATSDNYVNSYKLSIQYNSTGQRVKDIYTFYNPASVTSTIYTYNDQNQVTANYSFNQNGDSTGKGFYNYTPEHFISNYIQLGFDEELLSWMPSSADSLEYNAEGYIHKYTRYLMISTNGGDPEFGPFSIDEYQYTSTGKLKEILAQNWNGTSWELSNKTVITYVNEKPTVGYFYRSDDGATINTNPSYRYTFAPMTGTTEVHSALATLSVYPNPGNEALTIDLGQNKGTATIFDNKGSIVLSVPVNNQTTVNTATLASGIYLLKLQSGSEQTIRKIVIQH